MSRKNMIIKGIISVAMVLVIVVTACKGLGSNGKDSSGKTKTSVTVSSVETGTTVSTEGQKTETSVNTDGSDQDKGYGSLAELFKATDPEWNASDAYTEAVAAYDALLPEIIAKGEYLGSSYGPNFLAAYIDGDNVPELLVSYGDFHPCGICVYCYDPREKEVCYLGEYGIYGQMSYEPKAGHIHSSTGGQGLFAVFRTDIDGSRVSLGDVFISDGTGFRYEGVITYSDVPVPEGMDGSHESMDEFGTDWMDVTDLHGEISDPNVSVGENGSDTDKEEVVTIDVNFDEMFPLNWEQR